ncbi:MAG: hypothetical protein B6242_11600 [Anaerolineaceae bacterium 4572_78]|nr:MAG: hypothetical protein B6242_11600 [Anaerolineaceae bacterium 4572_78]
MQLQTLSPNGVIFDTNALSIFAKVSRLDLIQQIFTVPLYVTPAIKQELQAGIDKGITYLSDAMQLIDSGKVGMLIPNRADKRYMPKLPNDFGPGETEGMPLCHRLNMTFITRDKKAINVCLRENIGCIPLTDLITIFEQAQLLTSYEVSDMLA